MPLITNRDDVLSLYREAASRGWVLPAFNAENLTGMEAILDGALAVSQRIGMKALPVIVGITRCYDHRSQSSFYTHTRDAEIGLRLFMADLGVLTGDNSPYANLSVMVHLDHIQWDADGDLLSDGDLSGVSSIMFDASTLPLDENISRTRDFMRLRGHELMVEGACDEIGEASEGQPIKLTSPEMAERFAGETGVDIIVANLGTEHRAGAADLKYRGDLARSIRERIGPRICLHGTSSVPPAQVKDLFADGVCKVNIWTALERDSTPALFEDMLRNAGRVAGPAAAERWRKAGLLGPEADVSGPLSIAHCTTTYRQSIIFREMRQKIMDFMGIWYV